MKPFAVINPFFVAVVAVLLALSTRAQDDFSELLKTGYQWKTGLFFEQAWGGAAYRVPKEFDADFQTLATSNSLRKGGIVLRYGTLLDVQLGMAFTNRSFEIAYSSDFNEENEARIEETATIRSFGAYVGLNLKIHKYFWLGFHSHFQPMHSYIGDYTLINTNGDPVRQSTNQNQSPFFNNIQKGIDLGAKLSVPLRITPNVLWVPHFQISTSVSPLYQGTQTRLQPNGHVSTSEVNYLDFSGGFQCIIYFTFQEKYSQGR